MGLQLAEDNLVNQKLLARMLKSEGVEVGSSVLDVFWERVQPTDFFRTPCDQGRQIISHCMCSLTRLQVEVADNGRIACEKVLAAHGTPQEFAFSIMVSRLAPLMLFGHG